LGLISDIRAALRNKSGSGLAEDSLPEFFVFSFKQALSCLFPLFIFCMLIVPFAAVDQLLILPGKKEVRVAGIIKNFHYGSLRDPIGSFYFEYDPKRFNFANVKFPSREAARDLTRIEAQWKTIGGEDKFNAQFLSDKITDSFEFYLILIKLWGFLGLMAITVACLGLLGTVVFTIRNRVKEISLRKVMGASSESLVVLLSKDFIILMVIASVITIPVMDFAFERLLLSVQYYSVTIGVADVVISFSIMFLLGMAAILSQTLRAANANPVDNLRVE
jgi:putative ABC transport system permease protein